MTGTLASFVNTLATIVLIFAVIATCAWLLGRMERKRREAENRYDRADAE